MRLALQIGVHIFLYFLTVSIFGPLLVWTGGYLVGLAGAGLLGSAFANWLAMRIYEGRPLRDIGLRWSRDSAINLGLGFAGGAGAAVLVLAPPLLLRMASLQRAEPATWGMAALVPLVLLLGSAGEEMLMRGFGFQKLVRALGPYATIFPVGVIFAAMHSANPHATALGLANTAAFGILFGYAFLRSHDIWLPLGLHFGWNVALPLFGVNVSGIEVRMTGYEMRWSAGPLWSGGEYGPEASLLTTAVFAAQWLYLANAPVRRQTAPLVDAPPVEPVEAPPGVQ